MPTAREALAAQISLLSNPGKHVFRAQLTDEEAGRSKPQLELGWDRLPASGSLTCSSQPALGVSPEQPDSGDSTGRPKPLPLGASASRGVVGFGKNYSAEHVEV